MLDRMWFKIAGFMMVMNSSKHYRGHSSYINAVAIMDTIVITGSADSTIRKWCMTTCECLFVYEGHSARIQRYKFLCFIKMP